MVARAMVAPTGQSIPVRLFNPTIVIRTIVIHSGTHIATMESVESPHHDITVASVQPDISPFKQEMLEQMVRQSEEHLTDSQRKQLLQLLECYSDVFADCKDDFGRTNRIQHQIPTGESAPIRQPVRRVPPTKRSKTRELLQGMLKKDVIQPSSSPWASPIVLVKKKDGSTRFCVDYRKVIGVTRKDAHPLPRVDDTLDTLAGAKLYTSFLFPTVCQMLNAAAPSTMSTGKCIYIQKINRICKLFYKVYFGFIQKEMPSIRDLIHRELTTEKVINCKARTKPSQSLSTAEINVNVNVKC